MKIEYAHCVKYTVGQLDRYPFSDYVRKSVDVVMFRHHAPMPGWEDDTFSVEHEGQAIGWGDSKDDALFEARYRLMKQSQESAKMVGV